MKVTVTLDQKRARPVAGSCCLPTFAPVARGPTSVRAPASTRLPSETDG